MEAHLCQLKREKMINKSFLNSPDFDMELEIMILKEYEYIFHQA